MSSPLSYSKAPRGWRLLSASLAFLLLVSLLLGGCQAVPTAAPAPTLTGAAARPLPPETQPSERVPLVVFGAGSLIIPFDHLEKAFELRYPDIDVQAQYHGSIQVIRHATELHEAIDVIATADASLIPMLMYESQVPESGAAYADWYIRFASNRLALAYTGQSKYAGEINLDNWYQVLSRRDVRTGLADPRFDASGYRALMAFALANDYYQQPAIFLDMFNGRFQYPVTIFQDEELTTLTVPEIVEPVPDTGLVIRGASIQLIALLQSGELDYAFEYESVIRQHGLEMFSLPEALNLGSPEADYSHVLVELDFQRFQSVKPEFRGERIGYGITIPSNAPHPEQAALFIEFLLSEEGRVLMLADQHPLFDPALAYNYANLPPALQALCAPAE
mgnify:CR=1 FL=1